MLKTYYCEVTHIDEPHFPGYKWECSTDQMAIAYFKLRWKDRLMCVYDEDFKIIYEAE